jgi:hypothetical protein
LLTFSVPHSEFRLGAESTCWALNANSTPQLHTSSRKAAEIAEEKGRSLLNWCTATNTQDGIFEMYVRITIARFTINFLRSFKDGGLKSTQHLRWKDY